MSLINHYQVLGVSEDASLADIKKAYRKNALQFHPDRNVGLDAAEQTKNTEQMKKINEAYEHLSDADKRVQYDRALANQRHAEANHHRTQGAETKRQSTHTSTNPHTSGTRANDRARSYQRPTYQNRSHHSQPAAKPSEAKPAQPRNVDTQKSTSAQHPAPRQTKNILSKRVKYTERQGIFANSQSQNMLVRAIALDHVLHSQEAQLMKLLMQLNEMLRVSANRKAHHPVQSASSREKYKEESETPKTGMTKIR